MIHPLSACAHRPAELLIACRGIIKDVVPLEATITLVAAHLPNYILDMPIPSALIGDHISAQSYHSPSSIPHGILDFLRSDSLVEGPANIILPHLLKTIEKERHNDPLPRDQLWIVCQRHGVLDFVLSCTEGPMGPYPVFIFASAPFSQLLDFDYTRPAVAALVHELLGAGVSRERVFSIFAPEPVTEIFAAIWSQVAGVRLARSPKYYAATFTYCTAKSFINKTMTVLDGFSVSLRAAVDRDVPVIAELCQAFSETSPPFLLTFERALEEARMLVKDGQVWVHEIRHESGEPDIASIVAFTRVSTNVAAITKVYTNPRWRQRGCALRLVRRVTKHLLKTKQAVVLYVSHGNPAARVYDQAGYVGLRGNAERFPGVDRWLELGFDTDVVELGHW